jgi:hypothetical protein
MNYGSKAPEKFNEGKMTNKYSTDTNSQRQRILDWLRTQPLSTYQARTGLDVFHPSSRVQELKAQGHNIITQWETIDTGRGKHRIAKYVLFSGGVLND